MWFVVLRILERAWAADSVLKDVLYKFVRGPNALVMRVEHSPLFKSWFKKSQPHAYVKLDSTVASLRAAKHRFESYIKPLARLTLYIEAMIATAMRIIAERGNLEEANDAKTFLLNLSEENLVMLAMMADAGDETAKLIRTCDQEDWDTAMMFDMLQNFKDRISFLFEHGGVLRTQTFTSVMLMF